MQNVIKVIAPSSFSMGELANAMTALAPMKEMWQICFLVSRKNIAYVHSAGFSARALPTGRNAPVMIRQEVSAPEVAGVIIADHHLFGLEHFSFSLDDACSGAPTLAFDSLCFGHGPVHLEMAVGKCEYTKAMRHWFPPSVNLPQSLDTLPLLRPVPVAGITRPEWCFKLFSQSKQLTMDNLKVKQCLGVESGRKLVVIGLSAWASMAMLQPGIGVPNQQRTRYLEYRFRWLCELMRRIGAPIALLGITPESIEVDNSGIQFIDHDYLSLDAFTQVLAAADLYISDNLTSGAMARAAALGTPVMAFVNQRNEWDNSDFTNDWRKEMDRNYSGFDFQYLVHPFGWAKELAPLLANNAYLAALPRAEAYDLDAQASLARELIDNHDTRCLDALLLQTRDLPSGPEIITKTLNL